MFTNVTGGPKRAPRRCAIAGAPIHSPVSWEASSARCAPAYDGPLLEVGAPGSVLKGLVRRIRPHRRVHCGGVTVPV